ncbi:hypothetical protein KM043_014052 [Ampulex compressa]|nr:hypothetical protein KM043_014052 [Ampulex compressa]
MSTAAKVTFAACCATTIGIIGYVHIKQQYDREQLHLGVIRDLERQEFRKAERLHILQQQIELGNELAQQAINQSKT